MAQIGFPLMPWQTACFLISLFFLFEQMFITALAKWLPSSLVVTGLSSELHLRVLDVIPSNALSLMLQRQPVPSSISSRAMQPVLCSCCWNPRNIWISLFLRPQIWLCFPDIGGAFLHLKPGSSELNPETLQILFSQTSFILKSLCATIKTGYKLRVLHVKQYIKIILPFSENDGKLSKPSRISMATFKFEASFQIFLTFFFFPKRKCQ